MHHASRLVLLFAVAALSSSQARADEARALVTIGMQRVFEDMKPAYEAASDQKLNADFAATADIVKRVQEGQAADFIIVSRAGADRLVKAGKVAEDSTFVVAQSSIALAIPAGHPKPDISTVEKLKAALLAAQRISYTDPASGGPSGIHLSKIWDELGIANEIRSKTKFPPAGGFVGEILASDEADIGIQQFPELSSFKGVEVVGPLPSELQEHIEYAVAIPASAVHPAAGKAFLVFMRAPQGIAALRAKGLDPR
ncbi:MAG: substrate-binding domain-containing protein [Methylobacteriaceae bacterium]|nr:substrate-binding domain-containing protein [Methylobacteriaceae bacterium]